MIDIAFLLGTAFLLGITFVVWRAFKRLLRVDDEQKDRDRIGSWVYCPTCSVATPADGRYCAECGAPMVCPSCGFENPPGWLKCRNCGLTRRMSDILRADMDDRPMRAPKRLFWRAFIITALTVAGANVVYALWVLAVCTGRDIIDDSVCFLTYVLAGIVLILLEGAIFLSAIGKTFSPQDKIRGAGMVAGTAVGLVAGVSGCFAILPEGFV